MSPLRQAEAQTPEALLARFRSGRDLAALATLFDRLSPELFRIAVSVAGDPVVAEEALQETWILVLEDAGRFDGSRPLVPWLVGVLENKVREVRRRERRRLDPERVASHFVGDPEEAGANRSEDCLRARAAIETLSEPYRSAALLRWVYGMEPAEIANVRNEPPGTTRSLLSRALRQLRATAKGLPAAFFAGGLPEGLAAIRARVLAAGRRAISAGPAVATGASTAAALGTFVTAKTVLAAVGALLAVALGWHWITDWGTDFRSFRIADSRQADAPAQRSDRGEGDAQLAAAPTSPPAPLPDTSVAKIGPTIRGRVQDSRGKPLRGAHVSLRSAGSRLGYETGAVAVSTLTDESGAFELPRAAGLPPYVTAAADGFTTETAWSGTGSPSIQITLWKAATIDGRVLDADTGAPVVGARVRARSPAILDDRAPVWERVIVSTADGRYAFPDAPQGRIRLEAKSATHAPTLAEVETSAGRTTVRNLAVARGCRLEGLVHRAGIPAGGATVRATWRYDPEVSDEAHADEQGRYVLDGLLPGQWQISAMGPSTGWGSGTIDVPADARSLTLDLPTAGTRTIDGRVLVRGRPVQDARVESGPFWEHAAESRTDAQGRFSIEVPDGSGVRLKATVDGVGSLAVEVPLSPDPSVPLDIDIEPWGTVRGRILVGEGALPPQTRLDLSELGPEGYDAVVAEDGTFTLRVRSGRWQVRAMAPGWPLSLETLVEVGPGREVAGVEVVLPAGKSVRGRVVDDRGAPVARVHIDVSTDRYQPYPFHVTTDDDGRFEAHGIQGPEVSLSAYEWERFGAVAQRVAVGRDDVVLTFPTYRSVVRGRVRLADGRPAPSFTLLVWDEPPPETAPERKPSLRPLQRFVDREGRFEVRQTYGDPSSPLTFALMARTADGVSVRVEGLRPSESASSDVLLIVAPGGFVAGHVSDSGGKPIPFATLRPYGDVGWASRTTTDASGSFRLGPLAAGRHEIAVGGASGLKWLGTQVRPVVVEAGQDTTLDVTLVFGGDVRVVVTDVTGRPVVGARAEFLDAAATVVPLDRERSTVNGPRPLVSADAQQTTDATGLVFRRFLPLSTRRVRVTKDGFAPTEADVAVVDETLAEVHVTLAVADPAAGR